MRHPALRRSARHSSRRDARSDAAKIVTPAETSDPCLLTTLPGRTGAHRTLRRTATIIRAASGRKESITSATWARNWTPDPPDIGSCRAIAQST